MPLGVSVVDSLGGGRLDGGFSGGGVGLGDVGGFGRLLGGRLGIVELVKGVLELSRDVAHALLGVDYHTVLGGRRVLGFEGGLTGVVGPALGFGQGGGEGVELGVGLLGGLLGCVGGGLGLLVLGDLALQLVLGLGQLPLQVADDGLPAYDGGVGGLGGLQRREVSKGGI